MSFKSRTRTYTNGCPQWEKYCKPADDGGENGRFVKLISKGSKIKDNYYTVINLRRVYPQ